MGSLGSTQLICLLIAVAVIAATCGFIGSTAASKNRRRARKYFLLGVFCGVLAGPIIRRSRRLSGRSAVRLLARGAARTAATSADVVGRLPILAGHRGLFATVDGRANSIARNSKRGDTKERQRQRLGQHLNQIAVGK